MKWNSVERRNAPGASPGVSRVSKLLSRRFVVLVAVAVLVRLALAPLTAYLPGNGLDDLAWRQWMEAISTYGIINVFRVSLTDYVGFHWILWLLSLVYDAFGGSYAITSSPPSVDPNLHRLLKIPPLIFDLCLIVAVYLAFRSPLPRTPDRDLAWANERQALLAAGIIAFHPAVLYDGAVWSQIDSGATAAMLAAIALLARGQVGWAWGIWAAGFVLKPQPIIVLPVLLALTLRWFGWQGAFRGTVTAALVMLALIAPWILHGDLQFILDTYEFVFSGSFYQGTLSMGAWNPWWLVQIVTRDLATDPAFGLLPVTYKQIGLALSASSAILAGGLVWLRPTLRTALIAGAYLAFAFYLLPTATHERYLYPLLALLLPVALHDRRWLQLYVAISVTFFLNLIVIGPPIYALAGRWVESGLSWVVALVHLGLFAGYSAYIAAGITARLRSAYSLSALRRGLG
jgi:dolichyl-phosphate-mannose-protein mannosyltransferase